MREMLPIAIVGVTDHCKDKEDYILNEHEQKKVYTFYEDYGFRNVIIERIEPTIGVNRDEVRADLPDGWSTAWKGYWGDYFDDKGVKQFSVFRKGAPWDYCFFARR